MTWDPVDGYLYQLQQQLRHRGVHATRLIDEMREHLVDAIDDGRQRGLSLEDAAGEAFERVGAPEIVAAHADSERDWIMNRVAAVLELVWRRKWWILAPTLLTAAVTSMATYYFLPNRYRSEVVIAVISQRLPPEYVRPITTAAVAERLVALQEQVLSRTRLERVITEFDLYRAERQRIPVEKIIERMRQDIELRLHSSNLIQDDVVGAFGVSFVSSDPNMAMKITQRLAGMLIEANILDRKGVAQATSMFLAGQIADVRKRLIAQEQTLDDLRAKSGGRTLSQADLLPFEALKESYKALLIKAEESKTAEDLERRMIGEQFKVIEPARVANRPLGPSRLGINIAGTLAGLSLGMVLVVAVGRSKTAI